MSLQKVGINFSGIGNVTNPEINVTTNVVEWVADIPYKANEVTGGNLGTAVMGVLFAYMSITLSDRNEFGKFRYSNIRAIGISAGVVSLVGIVMVNIGYYSNFIPIGIFLGILLLAVIATILDK